MNQTTNWHQDLPAMPLDRAGGLQFWLALCDIVPEMGSIQHLSGSQHEPPRGRQGLNGTKLADDYPDIWEKYELSDARTYREAHGRAIRTMARRPVKGHDLPPLAHFATTAYPSARLA